MSVRDEALIEVQNLTGHTVVYKSYDGRRRSFAGQQTMRIPAIELRQLAYTKGGITLIKDFLSVKNNELAMELGVEDLDHEYNWKESDVVNLLKNGSVDRLRDALDFAPAGIVELIIDKTVEMALPDTNKRKAIFEMTGRNVDAMIKHVEESKTTSETTESKTKTRRVSDEKTDEAPKGRRVED